MVCRKSWCPTTRVLSKVRNLGLSCAEIIFDTLQEHHITQRRMVSLKEGSKHSKKSWRNYSKNSDSCYRWSGTNHKADQCVFKNKECFFCHSAGHTAKVCRKRLGVNQAERKKSSSATKFQHEVNNSEVFDEGNDVNDEVFNLYPVTCTKTPPLIVDILVNDNNFPMEIDTGASLTITSIATFKKNNCESV